MEELTGTETSGTQSYYKYRKAYLCLGCLPVDFLIIVVPLCSDVELIKLQKNLINILSVFPL